MDSYWRAESLHGNTAHAHGRSLPPLRACPGTASARKHALGRALQVCALAASGIHNSRLACHCLRSAATRRQGQDVSSHCCGIRMDPTNIVAGPEHGRLLHASRAEQPSFPSRTGSPKRGATLAGAPARGSVAASAGAGSLMDVFQAIQAQMQGMAASDEPPLADVEVSKMAFHPAGTEAPLLQDISFRVPAKKLGLIYGRSGAGKTTLLQLIAGLTTPTSGTICITETAGNGMKSTVSTPTDRLSRTGLVFQFPERHFLASTLQQELAFAWPSDMASLQLLSSRAAVVLPALGLAHIPLETPLRQLSDGYKRRCALAVALVRRPSVLLLDEPLAGLDWRSRADIASVLGKLKEECTVIVVSHDLREIAPLVDVAWEMQPNGTLSPKKDIRLLDNAVL